MVFGVCSAYWIAFRLCLCVLCVVCVVVCGAALRDVCPCSRWASRAYCLVFLCCGIELWCCVVLCLVGLCCVLFEL